MSRIPYRGDHMVLTTTLITGTDSGMQHGSVHEQVFVFHPHVWLHKTVKSLESIDQYILDYGCNR